MRKNSRISGILREIPAVDTPTRTGDGSRRRAEKLSDDENCANKNRVVSEGPENFSGKKAKRREEGSTDLSDPTTDLSELEHTLDQKGPYTGGYIWD